MVITKDDFEAALGGLLAKATDVSIKNVLGTFDKEKTVPQNIAQLKERSSGLALQDTIAFLKANSPEYPAAQHVLSCKNRNKEEYSRDIAKFLDFVKPTQCLACRENYIPAAEQWAGDEPQCYLCQRPSHGVCYKDTVIKPELGVIFVCTECISVKAARELAADLQKQGENQNKKSPESVIENEDHLADHQTVPVAAVATTNHDNKDCPLYLKRQCPHGLTGKREIDGNPCPYKHRKHCKYFTEYGPTGCHFGKKCFFLHPALCQNSLKLNACLNRNCQELHIKGTQRYTRNIPENPQPTITTSNRFPSWMVENSHANIDQNRQSESRSDGLNPWNNNQQTPIEKQTPPKTDINNSRDFLERHLEEMKADLMSFIRTTITQAVPSIQPQYMMMQPASFSQQTPAQPVPTEHRTISTINAQTAPQLDAQQVSNYQQQYPTMQQASQMIIR
jgi:hypothetical protein